MHNQWCGTETRQMMTTGNLKVRRKGCNCQVLLMAGFGKLKAKVSKPSAWGISRKDLLAMRGWRVQLWLGHLTYGTGQACASGGPCEGAKMISSSVGIKTWGRKEWAEKGGGERAFGTEWAESGVLCRGGEKDAGERELRRVVGGWRRGEGLGGEWELGRLVVPAETGTRWQPGSFLSAALPALTSLRGHRLSRGS